MSETIEHECDVLRKWIAACEDGLVEDHPVGQALVKEVEVAKELDGSSEEKKKATDRKRKLYLEFFVKIIFFGSPSF